MIKPPEYQENGKKSDNQLQRRSATAQTRLRMAEEKCNQNI